MGHKNINHIDARHMFNIWVKQGGQDYFLKTARLAFLDQRTCFPRRDALCDNRVASRPRQTPEKIIGMANINIVHVTYHLASAQGVICFPLTGHNAGYGQSDFFYEINFFTNQCAFHSRMQWEKSGDCDTCFGGRTRTGVGKCCCIKMPAPMKDLFAILSGVKKASAHWKLMSAENGERHSSHFKQPSSPVNLNFHQVDSSKLGNWPGF